MSEADFLEFKYKKNHLLQFPDGQQYAIPHRQIPSSDPKAQGYRELIAGQPVGPPAMVPHYDMDKVFQYPLLSEEVPEDIIDLDDSNKYYASIKEDAFREASEARRANDVARSFFYFYASKKGGEVLEVVSDPYKDRRVKIGKASKKIEEVKEQAEKPSHPKSK